MIHNNASASAERFDARRGTLDGGAAAEATSRSDRIAWIDHARGLNILIVVVGHVLSGLQSYSVIGKGSWSRIWEAGYHNFRMPFFFVLSGLFAERLVRRDIGPFLRDRGAVLLYPYFVWSTLQILVQIAISDGRVTPDYLLWQAVVPFWQFWFLRALFLVSLAYFAMRKLGLGPLGCLVACLAAHAAQDQVRWDGRLLGLTPGFQALYYAPFYAAGAVVGRSISRFRVEGKASLTAITAAGFGVAAMATWSDGEPPLPIRLGVTLCGVGAATALSALLSRSPGMDFLRGLGRHSLEILVTHMYGLAAARMLLTNVLHVRNGVMHAVLGVAFGVAFPLLLVWTFNRIGVKYAFRLPRPAKSEADVRLVLAHEPRLAIARASS